jgi:uncharacterized protein
MIWHNMFIEMNLRLSNFVVSLAILCLAGFSVFSQESKPFSINESPLPAPTSPVMDFAGVLDAAAKQSLEKRLTEFRDKTNPRVELAVAVVRTTGDRPIFDYSLAVARGWKIGSKETDNPSALLFIAIDDRKYFTQVSRDLEDELPDGLVGQLQRQYLVPAFRQGNYAKGISDTMEAYIRAIEAKQTGEAPPAAGTTKKPQNRYALGSSTCGLFICLIIIFIIFLGSLSRAKRSGYSRHDRDRWRGGGFGGGTSSVLPWIIGSAIANSIGDRGGSSSDWGGSDGGDSWGGFGGGGDFGGGGAGGDW